jgi:hypothetical protein
MLSCSLEVRVFLGFTANLEGSSAMIVSCPFDTGFEMGFVIELASGDLWSISDSTLSDLMGGNSTTGIVDDFDWTLFCEGLVFAAGSDNMLAKDIGSFARTGFYFDDNIRIIFQNQLRNPLPLESKAVMILQYLVPPRNS